MREELAADVRIYAAEMTQLREYTEWLELSAALVYRDAIERALASGEELTADYDVMLREADDKLLASRDDLVRRFPEVFADRAPREYWWWHLDEGPQVRAEAEAA